MIYLIYGDIQKAKAKAKKMLGAQLVKDKDAAHFKIDEENFSEEELQSLAGSGALFQSKIVVVLDRIFSSTKTRESALLLVSLFKDSDNIFIITEGELTKDILGKLEKASEKVEKIETKTIGTNKTLEFPIFSLADALGSRDKKKLWTLFVKAKLAGVEAEEIHRILLWQMKAILAAGQTQTAGEAALNPFVFSKSSRYAKSFSKEELERLSWNLVEMHHESRRGMDLETELERWILRV